MAFRTRSIKICSLTNLTLSFALGASVLVTNCAVGQQSEIDQQSKIDQQSEIGQQSKIGQQSNSSETEVPELPRHSLIFAHHSDAGRKDYDLWKIAADGTQMASIVTLPNHQSQFAISPDGESLVFNDQVDGEYDLYLRKFSGGKAENITNSSGSDSSPSWSPDGKQIAFVSDRDTEKPDLYVFNLATKETKRLTNNKFHESGTYWSADGNTILFTRFFPADNGEKQSGDGEIMALDVGSGEERQLTQLKGYCGGANVSPDGKQIAFHRLADEGAEIWVMNVDGSEQRAITKTFLDEYSPAWSPDGKWIAYTAGTGSDGQGTFDLWLMLADGTQQRVISTAPNTQMNPRWRLGNHFCR